MRKRLGMFAAALMTVVGLSLIAPEQTAFARHRCGGRHHHRRGGCCGATYQGCGTYNNCGSGCATAPGAAGGMGGPGMGGPGMSGPSPAPGAEAPPPAPAPGA